jgi:hypothetical protein
MKTPKRYPATMSVYATRDELRQDRARWKRKNRIRQLKATIARQKKEYESLWESFSHMSRRCCQLLYPTDKP